MLGKCEIFTTRDFIKTGHTWQQIRDRVDMKRNELTKKQVFMMIILQHSDIINGADVNHIKPSDIKHTCSFVESADFILFGDQVIKNRF